MVDKEDRRRSSPKSIEKGSPITPPKRFIYLFMLLIVCFIYISHPINKFEGELMTYLDSLSNNLSLSFVLLLSPTQTKKDLDL